jgi:hypothetical protein
VLALTIWLLIKNQARKDALQEVEDEERRAEILRHKAGKA